MGRRYRIVVEALRGVLPEDKATLAMKSFDVVGDIAILKIPEPLEEERFLVAEALRENLPYIKTVLRQVGVVEGDFRTRTLEWLSGEKKTVAHHKEHGCVFEVDLSKAYFSPRLLHERARVAELCCSSGVQETVLNMFSGVGCFSVIIAKRCAKVHVYSVDLNHDAVKYQLKNVRLNRVGGKVTVAYADAQEIAENLLRARIQRVLMPLPEKAYEYLKSAIVAIGPSGGVIHYHDFAHAHKRQDSIEKVALKVARKLDAQSRDCLIKHGRTIRTIGPNWYQVVLDILVR